ncbi:hypothetical protein [Leptospira alstonii]|uniref:Uncharacterized protein n=1 Tax=Leptospira alstonii serovar Sichuan str. 79601 TaxID=1218565 RepID=M6D2Q7_9LEPT|nr:hypothetical protein [Leptospira alstonii]AGS80470.1 hypothetical protein LEP1GSC193_0746 [Leptospira phage vB_LalZ_80412-LE1]EMJ95463.1 hypothetical protein LEP1GSC194_3546 [Leptospira alstonii serovar Sichuan str. 79601]
MDANLREDDIRKQDGRDKGLVLITYPAPPEDVVVDYFRINIPLTGLEYRNINVPIEHGHPLYQEGISTKGPNTKFPKIGIECATEKHTQFLGLNELHFENSEKFLEYLKKISELPESRRIASKSFLDEFSNKKYFQQFQFTCESDVIITGFVTGAAGRNTNKFLYDSALATTLLLANDLPVMYPGLTVFLPEDTEPNLTTTDFSEPFWGFEIKLKIVQTKSIFRTKPAFLFPDIKTFDVSLTRSRTRFEGRFALKDKQGGTGIKS